ncbi:hypothetical protein G4B88_019434 [Cannabis sativa]|uniref:MADS-box domain-containing protein n=1 Tax=Cannabis sativa TaxID=3483 RepID=A0A7J6HZ19_CANSA|nr:hypothetical protein G4B88_019434 [Cannabis sativa]
MAIGVQTETTNWARGVSKVDAVGSKESKGSIEEQLIELFLKSTIPFGNARPIISMNIIDSCQIFFPFTLQVPITRTMGKRSLEEGEEQQQQKKNKNNKKKNPSNMLVSFSKRRDGLFKKASELCVKCGAQIAVVILSPAGIPHAFEYTSVDEVLQHYL